MFTPVHGNQGKVLLGSSTIALLTKWTSDIDLGIVTYNAQQGAGWQQTVRGNKKASGTLTGKYVLSDPIDSKINIDTLVTLVLYHDPSQRWISMSARTGKLSFSANLEGQPGEIQEWSCSYESDGAVTQV